MHLERIAVGAGRTLAVVFLGGLLSSGSCSVRFCSGCGSSDEKHEEGSQPARITRYRSVHGIGAGALPTVLYVDIRGPRLSDAASRSPAAVSAFASSVVVANADRCELAPHAPIATRQVRRERGAWVAVLEAGAGPARVELVLTFGASGRLLRAGRRVGPFGAPGGSRSP